MLLFVGVSFADTQQLSSYEAIILHASITDPTKDQEPYKLGPVKIPSVQQDGHSIKYTRRGNYHFTPFVPLRRILLTDYTWKILFLELHLVIEKNGHDCG